MFISIKANKKRIVAFLILVCVLVGACFILKNKSDQVVEPQEYLGGTNDQRIGFLMSFGWELEEKAIETREVMIPENFNEVYTAYNEMQKAQGFNLEEFAGVRCMQYKYIITNYPDDREVYATLLVYDQVILGGDIACAEVDGFMHGFASDSLHYGEKAPANQNDKPEVSGGEASQPPSGETSEASLPQEEKSANAEGGEVASAEDTANADTVSAGDAPVNDNTDGGADQVAGEVTDENAYPTD